ncbi:MAG: hypothetical protein ACI4TA_13545 [Acetatifactor sp.]
MSVLTEKRMFMYPEASDDEIRIEPDGEFHWRIGEVRRRNERKTGIGIY